VSTTETRTYTPPIRTYVGDDAFISAELDRESEYSTDLRIRGAKHNTVTTLHLSPAAVRDLRDTLTRCLVSLESEAIEAAGIETPKDRYPEALAIVRKFDATISPGNTFPAMNK